MPVSAPSPRKRRPAPDRSVPTPSAVRDALQGDRTVVFTSDGTDWIATFAVGDAALPPSTTAVFLDVNCVTDRSRIDAGSMLRDTDSGLWILSVRVPAGWRGAYTFIPSNAPLTVPDGDANQRQWWIDFRRGAIGSFEGAAPDAEPQRLRTGALPEGILTTETVELDGTPRRVGTYVPPVPGHGTVVLFDGDEVRRHRVLAAFDDPEHAPARVLVVDHVSADGQERNVRASDLTANPRFRDDLLAYAGEPVTVGGCSYGGLASMFFALTRPDAVRGAACLSPSMWWHDEQGHDVPTLAKADIGGDVPILSEVGSLEWMMLDEVAGAADRLAAAGHPIRSGTFAGGHDWVQWRERLPVLITELRVTQSGRSESV